MKLSVEGESYLTDEEIHEAIYATIYGLMWNDINNKYPAWTGSVEDWLVSLPKKVEFTYAATIEVFDNVEK